MECGQQQWKMKMLLLQCSALHKFHVIDGPNTHDQIPSDRTSTCEWSKYILWIPFLVEVQNNAGYINAMQMHNNSLEIRIVGCSC